MANKTLFGSQNNNRSTSLPTATAINEHGSRAYDYSDKALLAKVAMTGTLANSFYVSQEAQLDLLLKYADKVPAEFLAKTAIFASENGFMKDVPALLTAKLASIDTNLLSKVFPRVCRSGKMVRNFVQIIRSGRTGRKSLGTAPKRLIQNYLNNLPDKVLLNASVGSDPSIADVIKLSHPKPPSETRKAFYGYLIGKDVDVETLPDIVRKFESWKKSPKGEVPEVDFRLLTSQELTNRQWKDIAISVNWQTTRQGLNMFLRHNVFADPAAIKAIADKLKNEELIKRAKVFPFQLFAAYMNVEDTMPREIKNALQEATEIATSNIPEYPGEVVLLPDVSGSMQDPVTGSRGTATSKIRCVDYAALIVSAIARRNPNATIIPFGTDIHLKEGKDINPFDSIMTNAKKLADINGGGTNCWLPMKHLNDVQSMADLVIYVSDNESWVNENGRSNLFWNYYPNDNGATSTLTQWETYHQRNSKAKLVCIDITPNKTSQTVDRPDILNVAGLSDVVFDVVSAFLRCETNGDHLASLIELVDI